MNLSDAGIVMAITMSVAGAGGAAGKYWLDREYVPVGALQKAFTERDIRDIKRDIRELEWQRDNGGLTDRQAWRLNDLKHELEDLQQ